MSPDCTITEDEINALVDGELVGREQRRVASHVVACGQCSQAVGGILAEKRLLSARTQPIEAPGELWTRVSATLDTLDGLAKAADARPAPRLATLGSAPALAGLGCLLIVGALVWRTHLQANAGDGALFARAHVVACQRVTGGDDLPNVSDVVAPGLRSGSWAPLQRAVFSLDGQFVEHTLYRVNRTPISEFILAAQALDLPGTTPVQWDGATYLVRGEPGGSVVAWETRGVARVLVGRVNALELVDMAAERRAAVPLLRAY